jgi:putative transposase
MRKAVVETLIGKGLSQPKSCRIDGFSKVHTTTANDAMEAKMKELGLEHNRYGYRRIWALLRREG